MTRTRKRKASVDDEKQSTTDEVAATIKKGNSEESSRPTQERRVTRTMRNAPSREAVFATAELLEMIFLHLPPRTALDLPRVCRQFRDAVATSPQLQRDLFIRAPDLQNTQWWAAVKKYDPSGGYTRELAQIRDHDELSPAILVDLLGRTRIFRIATRFNPLFNICPDRLAYRRNHRDRIPYKEQDLVFNESPEDVRLVLGPATWKDTYFTEQPCKRAELTIHWSIATAPLTTGFLAVEASTERPDGFTVGALISAAMEPEADSHYYIVSRGGPLKHWKGSAWVADMQDRERKAGKKAVITRMYIAMHDVRVLRPGETGLMGSG